MLHLKETDKDISTWAKYKEVVIAWYNKYIGLSMIGVTAQQDRGFNVGPVYSAAQAAKADQTMVDLVQELSALQIEVQKLKEVAKRKSEETTAQTDFINQWLCLFLSTS